jgi:hypothetical protein
MVVYALRFREDHVIKHHSRKFTQGDVIFQSIGYLFVISVGV